MRTAMAETSVSAYHTLGPKLGLQQRLIVEHMARNCHRDFTRAELAAATNMRTASVCGRAAELLTLRVLCEGPARPCRLSGIRAHPLRLAPAQVALEFA